MQNEFFKNLKIFFKNVEIVFFLDLKLQTVYVEVKYWSLIIKQITFANIFIFYFVKSILFSDRTF